MTPLGTYRHLTQTSTRNGHFVVLAIDHRANLKANLDAAAPAPLTGEEFAAFKGLVLSELLEHASAVLTDPAYGIAQGVVSGAISGQHGILSPLEVTDYGIHPSQRDLTFIESWSVAKIKANGGSGVKLLLVYHPDDARAATRHEHVTRIVQECRQHQIPFFLEPIAYAIDPGAKLTGEEKRRIVVQSAKTFSAMGVDILKIEFPAQPTDPESFWEEALAELNEACGDVPWALLSAGVGYEPFLRQAELACRAGASGVIVGRAVWSDAVKLQGQARANFLKTTSSQRMAELASVVAAHAVDWRTKITPPSTAFDWYEG